MKKKSKTNQCVAALRNDKFTATKRKRREVEHKISSPTLSKYAWYDPMFQQKHINILGRTVDFHSLLTAQIILFVRKRVVLIIFIFGVHDLHKYFNKHLRIHGFCGVAHIISEFCHMLMKLQSAFYAVLGVYGCYDLELN